MPKGIREIRETIEATGPTVDGIVQFQKRIELAHGKAHTIQHIDFFDDGLLGATQTSLEFSYQVWLTNYPIVLTQEVFHGGDMVQGPLAGEDCVLFKAQKLIWGTASRIVFQEFPNQFLGSMPTFDFYTPQLYFTVVVQAENSTDPTITPTIDMSLYMVLQEHETDAVEYGIGMIREYCQNQAMLNRNNGVELDQTEIIGGMPMWQIGGIRPEITVATNATALGQQWFMNQAGYADAESMESTTEIRAGLAAARQTVAFGDAFGDSVQDIPDWFKAIAAPFAGIAGGALRSIQPPLKHFDNGNVMTL